MTNTVVAVADVHGCFNLLTQELEQYYGTGCELIFLGDLIDRSPDAQGDQKVLELVRTLQANPSEFGLDKVTVLRGNHEQLCIDAIHSGDHLMWLMNGASIEFINYLSNHPEVFEWIEDLPLYTIRGDYLFVHAGVMPDVPLDEQEPEHLLWIRYPFLSEPHGLPYTVVHGHTIQDSDEPVYGDKRISIDLGAFATGKLCTLPLTP